MELEEGEIEQAELPAASGTPPSGARQGEEGGVGARPVFSYVDLEEQGAALVLERKQRKKEKKARKAASKSPLSPKPVNGDAAPERGYHDVYGGEQARAEAQIKKEDPVRLADLSGLVLWVLGQYVCPRWIFIKNKPLVKGVALVLAHGVNAKLLQQHADLLPRLAALGPAAKVIGLKPTARTFETTRCLLTTPVKLKAQAAQEQEAAAKKRKLAPAPPPFPPSYYAATPQQMAANNYPTAVRDEAGALIGPEGFVETAPAAAAAAASTDSVAAAASRQHKADATGAGCSKDPSTSSSPGVSGSSGATTLAATGAAAAASPAPASAAAKAAPSTSSHGSAAAGKPHSMVALDCEMCVTVEGHELTRMTLIDEKGDVLVDRLVKPTNPIIDYVTRYSGITEEMLQGVSYTLQQARADFLRHVSAETLLVGHALENDLVALKAVHMRVLDTALMYPHPKGPPFKCALKRLAEKFLKRSIQDGSHDSVIDARAALDLAKLKIKHGPSWGTSDGRPFNALAEVLAEQGAKCCLVDRPDVLHRYGPGNVVTIPVYSDAQAAEAAAHHCSSGKYNFVWTQFTELAAFYQQRAAALRQGAEADRAKAATEGKEAAKAKAATEDKEEEEDEDSDEEAVEVVAGKRAAGGGEEAAGRAVKRRRLQQEEGAGAGAAVLAQSDSSSSEEEEEKAAQQGPGSSLPDRLKEQLARLDARVAQVYDAAPPNTLVIVATGVGDSAEAERLTELMCKRQQGLLDGLPPWSVADEDAHAAFLEEQLLGLAFIAVKQ